MNAAIFLSLATLLVMLHLSEGCSSTATGVTTVAPTTTKMARKRRAINTATEPVPVQPAMISALTYFKFDETKNKLNADSVEAELEDFVSTEQINQSKFGKAERILGDDKGFLRVSYTLSKGSRHCAELIQLATKAINLAENIAEGSIICNNEKIAIEKLE